MICIVIVSVFLGFQPETKRMCAVILSRVFILHLLFVFVIVVLPSVIMCFRLCQLCLSQFYHKFCGCFADFSIYIYIYLFLFLTFSVSCTSPRFPLSYLFPSLYVSLPMNVICLFTPFPLSLSLFGPLSLSLPLSLSFPLSPSPYFSPSVLTADLKCTSLFFPFFRSLSQWETIGWLLEGKSPFCKVGLLCHMFHPTKQGFLYFSHSCSTFLRGVFSQCLELRVVLVGGFDRPYSSVWLGVRPKYCAVKVLPQYSQSVTPLVCYAFFVTRFCARAGQMGQTKNASIIVNSNCADALLHRAIKTV